MTQSKNDLGVFCWTCIHDWWKAVSDIPERSSCTLDFEVLRMYAHTPQPNSFFKFLGLSSLNPSISPSAFFKFEFSQDSEIAKIAHFFSSIKFLTWTNALLSSAIVRSSVPRLLLISEIYFHGLLNARSHERLSSLQRCQLEYLISYFGLHHAVSLGSFFWRSTRIRTLTGLSCGRLRWFLSRCPLLGASKLRFLRVNHPCFDKGRCISP